MATKTHHKILYYSNSCGLHDLKFIRVLSQLSRNVLVISRSANSGPRELPGKVQFRSLSASDSNSAIRKLNKILTDHHPDVTVAGPLWPCAYEAAIADAPNLIATSWAFDVLIDAHRSLKIQMAIARALSQAQLILFDSLWVCEEARKIDPFLKSKAKIFPWGVDTKRFIPKPKGKTTTQPTFEILHTRTLDQIYRPEVLLHAFHLALQQKPHFRLKIIAYGPQLSKMQKLSKNLSLEQNVDWIPPIQNLQLPKLFKSASLYTTAACSDGVSISLLEAMASGIPVVVPDLLSNIHILSPLHRSQTFRLDDPQSLSQKWITMSELPNEARIKIGVGNRNIAVKKANIKKFEINLSKIVSVFFYD